MAVLYVVLFALSGCGGGSGGVDTSGSGTTTTTDLCAMELQNKFVYDIMKDIYLWYDKIPEIDYASYESPEKVMSDMLYSDRDRWSFITEAESYSRLYGAGQYVGLGFVHIKRDDGNHYVALVYPGSPADKAGVTRSYRITEVAGTPVEDIDSQSLWGSVLGEREIGVSVNMKFIDTTGAEVDLTLVKELVTIDTVFINSLLDIGTTGLKAGYLVYQSFLDTSIEDLNSAFGTFKSAGISELILDLRYNTGGTVSSASHLANLISGVVADGQLFTELAFNSKNSFRNSEYNFEQQDNSLNLSRLIVISSSSTCSASEMIINSLKPFMDVVQIGSTSCGKPVGMISFSNCEKVINPISFGILNANGEGEYFNGIAPDCSAEDGLTVALGDVDESMLGEALYYAGNDSCSAAKPGIAGKNVIPHGGFQLEIGAI